MNDRYLFKAKRTDNGEWVIGYYGVIGNIFDNPKLLESEE